MRVPGEINGEWKSLSSNPRRDENLRSVQLVREWLEGAEGYLRSLPTGANTDEPPVSPRRGGTGGERGISDSAFDGVDTATLRFWLSWWSDSARSSYGGDERARDPKTEADRVRREIDARDAAGTARRPA
jgi:hypothetical protein